MPSADVSETTLLADIISAEYWTTHINLYSEKMQELADGYGIAASLISTITGLAAWMTIVTSPAWWAQFLVGLMAFAAAAVAIIPRVRHYSECAAAAAPLATGYADALTELQNALDEIHKNAANAQDHAREAVTGFRSVKAKKDALKPFPWKLEEEINRLRVLAGKPAV